MLEEKEPQSPATTVGDLETGLRRPDPTASPRDSIVTESNNSQYDEARAALGPDAGPAPRRSLAPSQRFSAHQLFYIFVLDGLGGMVLSGGVNFAIAYAMYTTQDTEKLPIRLFQLPNTLAGDAAVTIIVQCILTWFVEWIMVAHDLANGSVQPVGFLPEPSHPYLRWILLLDVKLPSLIWRIFHQALRGFILCVPAFILVWPVGVGILSTLGTPSGGDRVYADRWLPQIFKLILGGVLGLLTTPLMAMFWLVKAGWEARKP